MIQVVRLEPSEWPRLKAIRLEALKTEPQAFGSNYERDVAHPDSLWMERLSVAFAGLVSWSYFAEVDGEIIGMISGYTFSPNTAEVTGFYVRPSYRGQGAGSLLLKTLLAHLDTLSNIEVVKLTVNADQAAALAAYRRQGFEVVLENIYRMGDGIEYPTITFERKKNP